MKLVVNRCHGGFGLSEQAMYEYAKRKGLTLYPEDRHPFSTSTTYWIVPENERVTTLMGEWNTLSDDQRKKYNELYRKQVLYAGHMKRDDPVLIDVVEQLGEVANGEHANLEVIEIPDDINWTIEEYDGYESVHEVHRSW